jgi:ABC-2 type transport system ATP-binding protein
LAYSLEVKDLTRHYGSIKAVDGVSFSIERGEIFGLLGPNGAGKTTTVEMIVGLRKPDRGSINICSIDALSSSSAIKELIGVQLQTTALYNKIRVIEAIELFGSYYKKSLPPSEILELVSLKEKKNAYYATLSGGQKQRLALGLALVNDPAVLFLDEPTTGLDPQARRNVWDIIENLKKQEKTVILTTHYMEEAERLCHRVAIIDNGRIIAINTPANLVKGSGIDSTVEFEATGFKEEQIISELSPLGKIVKDSDGRFIIYTRKPSQALKEISSLAEKNNINIEHINTRRATLEDVFISMTGRNLRE